MPESEYKKFWKLATLTNQIVFFLWNKMNLCSLKKPRMCSFEPSWPFWREKYGGEESGGSRWISNKQTCNSTLRMKKICLNATMAFPRQSEKLSDETGWWSIGEGFPAWWTDSGRSCQVTVRGGQSRKSKERIFLQRMSTLLLNLVPLLLFLLPPAELLIEKIWESEWRQKRNLTIIILSWHLRPAEDPEHNDEPDCCSGRIRPL